MSSRTKVTRTPIGITFAVDDVELAPALLPERGQFELATDLIGVKLECVSDPNAMLAETSTLHPLVAATLYAFCDHRPLVLSPDHIWCAIVQGLAHHIAQDPEAFRKHFVAHEGKESIKVRRDDFEPDRPNNPWQEVFGEFSAQIKEHIGDSMHQLIVADFTTTDPVARAVSQIALMDCTQSYFNLVLMSLCGIPQITLKGEVRDWEHLKDKICFLNERFDLGWWLDNVTPIADQFIKAAKGEPDRAFWSSIFKFNGMSGGPYLSGWLMNFFPYLKDFNSNEVNVKNTFLVSGGTGIGITTSVVPGSCCRAPFVWEYMLKVLPYEFIGGFIGVEQDRETMALTPKLGWAVRPKVRAGLSRFDRYERVGIFCQVMNGFCEVSDLLKRHQISEEELEQLKEEFAAGAKDSSKVQDFCYRYFQWLFRTGEPADDDPQGSERVHFLTFRSRAAGMIGDESAWDELEELIVSNGGLYSDIAVFKEARCSMGDEGFVQALANICSNLMLEYDTVVKLMRTAMKIVGGDECVAMFDDWLAFS